jgi:hypothetical protein
MIIINLKGGIGNQMFQYACGKALSLRNGEPIKLDITGYERTRNSDTPREYSLSYFNISATDIASDDEIRSLKYSLGIVSKGWRLVKVRILRQFNTGWNPRILSKKGGLYLDGFWQSERYFLDRADTIRSEFTLKNALGDEASRVADEIKKCPLSVSLHVRRGDVVRNAATNPYYGICTPEYYSKALSAMAQKVGSEDFRVFVFSDDIDWVKENIVIPGPTSYVSCPKIPDYKELALMSMCKHNIIANSSFSWWGAWLNKNQDKIVIAPKEWIQRNKRWHKDTVPKSWIRI